MLVLVRHIDGKALPLRLGAKLTGNVEMYEIFFHDDFFSFFCKHETFGVESQDMHAQSTTRKRDKRTAIAGVRRLQRSDIAAARFVGVGNAAAAPRESSLAEAFYEHIGHQAGVTAVTVGERVDRNQAVMEAHHRFVRWIGGVVDLVADIVKQLAQRNADRQPIDADVLVGLAKLARPAPGLAEHPPV